MEKHITKEEKKELKRIGKLLEKRWKAYRESEQAIAQTMSPILKRLEENKDTNGLKLLLEYIPICSSNGQFIYSTLYKLNNTK